MSTMVMVTLHFPGACLINLLRGDQISWTLVYNIKLTLVL